jgi:hypothetical protein
MARVGAPTHPAFMTPRLRAIPEAFAEDVRRTRRDPHGNLDLTPRRVESAHSAPCRVCLEDARVGEAVLLCAYSPFDRTVPYRTVGPVFVHAHRCAPYDASAHADRAGIPDALARRLLSVRAHDAHGTMLDCDVTEGRDLLALAARFLADPEVATLHVHHARAGCFACLVERAP